MYDDPQSRIDDAVKNAALSGAISGAGLGGFTAILSGVKDPKRIMKDALLASIASSAITGGSTKLGSEMMGAPDTHDVGGYTTRGTSGGIVGGGTLGAAAGGVIGSGKIPMKMPKIEWARKAIESLPLNNVIGDYMKKLATQGGRTGAIKGAIAGGIGLGGASAALASDEGMQLDFIMNKIQEEERRSARKRYVDEFI